MDEVAPDVKNLLEWLGLEEFPYRECYREAREAAAAAQLSLLRGTDRALGRGPAANPPGALQHPARGVFFPRGPRPRWGLKPGGAAVLSPMRLPSTDSRFL
jgi:hypothetical protein